MGRLLEEALAAGERYRASVEQASPEAFAREALRKCRHDLELLMRRLRAEGFPPAEGLLPCAAPGQIARVRQVLGQPPPRLLELFWEEVGGIELDVCEPGTSPAPHTDFFARRGILPQGPDHTTDALVVDGLSDDWLSYLEGELESFLDEKEEPGHDEELDGVAFLIPLAPDHLHKDNISGGGPSGVLLGDDDWLPRFGGEFTWVGSRRPILAPSEPDLMSYLRASVIECAGFPGLLGNPSFEKLREHLTEGFQPF